MSSSVPTLSFAFTRMRWMNQVTRADSTKEIKIPQFGVSHYIFPLQGPNKTFST